ncbi:MAG TPA: carbohydrate kinase family protein [Herpetosiphonaceae bacterium]|nr:carbohydrate kinase family protein [Herpetosiphonaceae bacterium]
MSNVLILGGVSFNTMIHLEEFPEPRPQTLYAQRFHETIGSTGAGKALNLRRLGWNVALHGPIGADEYGRQIREAFEREGVTFLYDIDPAGTQRHVNLMDAAGRRMSIFIVPGTFDLIFDRGRLEDLIERQDHVVLNIVNYCRTLIPAIKAHAKPTWVDLHSYDGANTYHDDFIQAADYLFLSSEAMPDYRPFMRRMIDEGKRLAVCTHGAGGSTALGADGEWIETPIAERFRARDTNGAGDAFVAGVLHGVAAGRPLRDCLRLGTLVSGLCVTDDELAAAALTPELLEDEYGREYGEGQLF